MDKTRIILDAYGGDHAPLEPLKGAALAIAEYGVEVTLCGNESELKSIAQANNISLAGMQFIHTDLVMPVEAQPTELTKTYAKSSMAVGMYHLAAGEGDAFVTAGSTGAAVVGATLIVKRIKGVKRPAIGTVIPCVGGCYMLLDAGANAECRPEMLQQFGIMGSAYMEKLIGIKEPRVGLVNIGAEETKGLELHQAANALLKNSSLHFIGNIEARDLPLGGCDVAVTDGFVGNIVLKLTEGMAKMLTSEIKEMLMAGVITKMAALMLKDGLSNFKKKLDYTEYGGAPLMGAAKPVIKAHGSSNAKAIKNAIRQAKEFHEHGVIDQIQIAIAQTKDGALSKGE